MFKLNTTKQIVLAQLDVHLIGNHGGLRLGHILIGKQITRQCPRREQPLSVIHHDLNHGSRLTILITTGLILERIGATQRIMKFAELTVQFSSKRGKAILIIVTAGKR